MDPEPELCFAKSVVSEHGLYPPASVEPIYPQPINVFRLAFGTFIGLPELTYSGYHSHKIQRLWFIRQLC